MPAAARRPLIVHVVHRFDVGGMENGVVNLINTLPETLGDHAVLALTEANPAFVARVHKPGVRIVELHKPPGQTVKILPRLVRAIRALRPTVFHTRNVATLETQVAAWLCRVPVRVHGEHGWDVGDLDGSNRTMARLRRVMRPFVHHQIALSGNTHRYLREKVGVTNEKLSNICNGVDTARFTPAIDPTTRRSAFDGVLSPEHFVVGAVGRLAEVKNVTLLIKAFAQVATRNPRFASQARLAIIGDGPQRAALEQAAHAHGIGAQTWFAGARADIPVCLRAMDVLCLPSLAEGISNAILEALASGVPVVATAVGGNPELIADGAQGFLVVSGDADAIANRLEAYHADPAMRQRHADAARRHAMTRFSLSGMVGQYHAVYERLIHERA